MKALSFGEILWDVIGDNEYLGGTVLNLSSHLSKLGNDSWIVSSVGKDVRGERALTAIKRFGVNLDYVEITEQYPTGHVSVTLNDSGQPTYNIHENVAWDNISLNIPSGEFDVFCFGTLAQRNQVSQNSLYQVLNKIKVNHVFFDVNLRQSYFSKEIVEKSLQFATIVKLNDEEVIELSKLLFQENLNEDDFAKKIIENFDLEIVIVTRGGEGCAVYSSGEKVEVPGIKIVIKDTVGAGDAFSAGFLHRYFQTNDLKLSAQFANELGAYVASRAGAIPD